MFNAESFFRRLLPLPLLAAATALAEQATVTYSNIVSNVVTPTNAVTFTDLGGHTYSNVTVKLIPYGLGWYAKDGSEGRLAVTNLDHVTLAEITGLSTGQVAYLVSKKAREDTPYVPQEATNSTPWWLEPCPYRLKERLQAKPGGNPYPAMYMPIMYDLQQWVNDSQALKDRQRVREMNERMQEMQTRAVEKMKEQLMRSVPQAPAGPTKP